MLKLPGYGSAVALAACTLLVSAASPAAADPAWPPEGCVDKPMLGIDSRPGVLECGSLKIFYDFDQDQADAFILEVRRIAAEGEVVETQDTAFGRKYTVPGVLKGPGGSVPVFTVWIQELGQQDIRLITVRPV